MAAESTAVAASETPLATQESVQAQPQAARTATPPPPTTTDQASDDGEEEAYDKERAMATIRKLRAEAKAAVAAIKERDQLKAAQQAAEDAKLDELTRERKRAAQLEAELAIERQERQDRINQYETQIAASKLGIVDPDAAVKLLDWESLDYDEAGRPKDIDKALKLLLRERPYLAGAPAAAVAVTNPATRASAPGSRLYSRAELADYAFYERHREDIVRAMRENRIVD